MDTANICLGGSKKLLFGSNKQLELAWFEKDHNSEKSAYFNMARENFYLGDLDKANFYHDRMFRGKVENSKSSLKTMSYHVIKSKRDAKLEK